MADYIPPAWDWVREQVERYEGSGGKEGTTFRDTGLPVIIVTYTGRKTGAIRKAPLMRVVTDDGKYVLVASKGEAPQIETHVVESAEAPSGSGEMAVPPAIGAIVNAVSAAAGKRVRKLPIRLA